MVGIRNASSFLHLGFFASFGRRFTNIVPQQCQHIAACGMSKCHGWPRGATSASGRNSGVSIRYTVSYVLPLDIFWENGESTNINTSAEANISTLLEYRSKITPRGTLIPECTMCVRSNSRRLEGTTSNRLLVPAPNTVRCTNVSRKGSAAISLTSNLES